MGLGSTCTVDYMLPHYPANIMFKHEEKKSTSCIPLLLQSFTWCGLYKITCSLCVRLLCLFIYSMLFTIILWQRAYIYIYVCCSSIWEPAGGSMCQLMTCYLQTVIITQKRIHFALRETLNDVFLCIYQNASEIYTSSLDIDVFTAC